jgi:Uma2 family endonuclease
MATLTSDRAASDALVLPCTWRAYVELMKARGENPAPRYTYVNGRLTVVSPRLDHETTKTRLAAMLDAVFLAARIRVRSAGSVTVWGGVRVRGRERKGTEPDLCYYLRDIDAIAGKTTLVMGVDPPPHLAVEVAVSHDPADQLEVLHHYRVPEVWVCRAGAVEVWKRDPAPRKRRWDLLAESEVLPFLTADELTQWAFDPEEDHTAFLVRFHAWVEAVVRPRVRP